MNLNDLLVKPGDPVQPFVDRLVRELPDLLRPYTTSGRVRFVSSPQGTCVIVDEEPAVFTPRFKVSAMQGEVTVKMGFVNDSHVPTIKGVPLDGVMPDKKVVPVPRLSISKDKPNADLKSWVHLAVRVGADGKAAETVEDWATITHAATLASPEELVGWQPLAVLTWSADGKSVRRVDQITMHNLKHAYAAAVPAKGQPGRHFFWSV
ncbi:hypothetical protein [Verrucomicrobium spinosum]|uniref:hypothetical protein n=2 Tax=Verrucomicrobium spinosum TaxID=2736 RepID=UPI0001746664|nr:hypothetical protein [Verrucomicrobium spinosum]